MAANGKSTLAKAQARLSHALKDFEKTLKGMLNKPPAKKSGKVKKPKAKKKSRKK